MNKPKSVRLQMILNQAIDHIRMATIHLVDRCLSKDYSRGKLAMKGTFPSLHLTSIKSWAKRFEDPSFRRTNCENVQKIRFPTNGSSF